MSLDSKVNSVFVKVYDCVILHSKGENDIDQLCCVLRVLGTPNETIWPGMSQLPDYNKITFPDMPPVPFEEVVPNASKEALDLLRKFLMYHSEKRMSAAEALVHPYFFTPPLPAHHSELPTPTRQTHTHAAPHDFSVDAPLLDSFTDPVLFRPSTHFKPKLSSLK